MSIVVVEAAELRRLIAEAVESVVGQQRAGGANDWVDARTSPLGRRAFLKLAREGAFPVSLVGNRYMARRVDVDAYLERQRITPSQGRELRAAVPNAGDSSGTGGDPIARALAAGRLRVVNKIE